MATGVVPSLAIALSTLVVGASSSAAGTGASALGRVVAGARALWPSYALAALGAVIWRLNVDESAPLALASIGLAMLAARSTLGAAGANAPRAKAQVSFAAVVWITFVYFACGQQLRGSTTNDAAYYFGMARHFAERARFDEPIVWHFLVRPEHVVHAPFDYWHGLTSLVLTPFLHVFGSTHFVAGNVMAGVSAASVLLFWYIVAIAAPLRSVWLQLAAVVAFAFSPALLNYRFDTETIAFAQLGLLGALAALAKQRYAWAALAGFGMFSARADTVGLLALVWWVVFFRAYAGPGPGSASGNAGTARVLRVAGVMVGSIALYVSYHLLVFGSPVPPGTGVAPALIHGEDLYRYRAFWSGPTEFVERRINLGYLEARARVALDALQQAELSKNAHVWLFLALVPGLARAARGHALARLCPWFLVLGAFSLAWSSPAVFAAYRAPTSLLPLLVLGGAYGAESLIERLERGVAQFASRARWLASSAAVTSSAIASSAAAYALTSSVEPYQAPAGPPALVEELVALRGRLGSGPVMSVVPWYVLAYTDSPAVMLPFNGEQAIAEVIGRYRVEWLLLLREVPAPEASSLLGQQLWAKSRTRIGEYELHEVDRTNERLLYRVGRAERAPKATAIRLP